MMGHHEKLKNGDEEEALTRARKWYCYLSKAGVAKAVKKRFWGRIRRKQKVDLQKGIE